MRLPLSWLKEFLTLELSPEEIAEALTLGGVEVEKIEKAGSDVLFEISLTPNLGHCMSVLGIARELAALKNLKVKKSSVTLSEESSSSIEEMISVEVQDKEGCLRYACRLLLNVSVVASPEWLKKKIEACGLRSVNNAVDITNYILLERGQPLHAFDYDKISGKKIAVTSRLSSSFVALDEKSYAVPQNTLVIADANGILALAGVIGGKESAVSEKTKNILIESAYFSPQRVRKTAKLLQVRTDSSQRFEKEVDPEGVIEALDYAASLMQKVCGGKIVKGRIDKKSVSFARKEILCRRAQTNALLGTALSLREMRQLLERADIQILKEEEEALFVSVPTYRNDLTKEVDLVEEIGRLYGYNNISYGPSKHTTSFLDHAPLFRFEKEVRNRLIGEGLQECVTCDLISPELAHLTAEAKEEASLIHVLHPASIDQSVLRASLLPGLLQMVRFNRARENRDISAFEMGRIHFKQGGKYQEQMMAALICCGQSTPLHYNPKTKEVDFFDLKGKVENILSAFAIQNPSYEPSHLHNFHETRQARIKVGDIFVGALGEIHPLRARALGIEERLYFAELNLHDLFSCLRKEWKVEDLPIYPGSERDWTLTMQEEVPVAKLIHLVRTFASPRLEKVSLVDIYRSSTLGDGKKNVTLRLFYRDREKTISLEEVEREHAQITQEVAKKVEHLLV